MSDSAHFPEPTSVNVALTVAVKWFCDKYGTDTETGYFLDGFSYKLVTGPCGSKWIDVTLNITTNREGAQFIGSQEGSNLRADTVSVLTNGERPKFVGIWCVCSLDVTRAI
jgi:hypothetical protein